MGDWAWFYFLNSFEFPSKNDLTDDASCRSGKFNMPGGRNSLNYGCISIEWDWVFYKPGQLELGEGAEPYDF